MLPLSAAFWSFPQQSPEYRCLCWRRYRGPQWLSAKRIIYRAGQHAHGVSANVALCFFVTAHPHDASWAGDQTYPEHIHEITTRARRRLYIVMEDLSNGRIKDPVMSDALQYLNDRRAPQQILSLIDCWTPSLLLRILLIY